MTTIGPSVHPVRLLGTMGLRNVGTAIAVPVGCFRYADQVSILYVYLALLKVSLADRLWRRFV